MRNITVIFIFALLLVATTGRGQAPGVKKSRDTFPISSAKADKAWADLVMISDRLSARWPPAEIQRHYTGYLSDNELARRETRLAGLRFWRQFPQDRRRYQWLISTLRMPPAYWKDIAATANACKNGAVGYSAAVDWPALSAWNRAYRSIRLEFLHSKDVLKSEKGPFHIAELEQLLGLSVNAAFRSYQKLDLSRVRQLFAAADYLWEKDDGITAYGASHDLRRTIEQVFLYHDQYGLSLTDLLEFTRHFSASPVANVRDWASQKISFLSLATAPLALTGSDVHGRQISLEDFKGKVVLLDFWSTTCSSCIARMPAIREAYEKLRPDGFEVISLCVDPEINLHKALRVENRIGASWPLLMIGGDGDSVSFGGLAKAIWTKYGFTGVPQLVLLDKQGLLAALNGVLQSGDMESLILAYLKQS